MHVCRCTQQRKENSENAESMREVTPDMLLLSAGSAGEGRHCCSVRSSIVTLTQNDSVGRHKTFTVPLLSSPRTSSYVNRCSFFCFFCKGGNKTAPNFFDTALCLCSDTLRIVLNARAVMHRVSINSTTTNLFYKSGPDMSSLHLVIL